MREIKFRAWDTEKNQWVYVSLGDLVCGATSKPSVPLGDEFTPADGDQSTNGEFQNWCEYTGLKDKNGKEIYEGDVVKSDSYFTSVVEFEDGSFRLKSTAQTSDLARWEVSHFELEVIGNVYENQELLTNPN